MSYFSTILVQSQKALCPTIAWTIIVKLSIEKKNQKKKKPIICPTTWCHMDKDNSLHI